MGLIKTTCSKDELAQKLESTRWALDFTWQQIVTISSHMEAFTAKSGEVMFEQHGTDKTMGIVVKGKVNIVKIEDGTESTIATIFPSQSFGEMSLIDGEPRSAQIVAANDVEILILSKAKLFLLVDNNPTLAFKLLWAITQMLSQRLRKTSFDLLEQMQQHS